MKKIPRGATAIVTGAGGGLGRALSRELGKRGVRVLATDVDGAAAEATRDIVRSESRVEALSMKVDVRVAAEVGASVALAEKEWGSVDVLVNNAGVAVVGRVGDITLDDWQFEVDVNLMGVIYGCHHAVPGMRRRRRGWILNVASAAGFATAPMMGPYNVTKAGVIALSETLRTELAEDDIAVSALCPTFLRTNIHKAQRSPPELRAHSERLVTGAKWSADDVAKVAIDDLEGGTLYVIPQADGKVMWRAKRALGQAFYAISGRIAARVTKG